MENQAAGVELGVGRACSHRAVSLFVEFYRVALEQETSMARSPLRASLPQHDERPEAVVAARSRAGETFCIKCDERCWENPSRLSHRRSASLPCRWAWKFRRGGSRVGRCIVPGQETPHAPVPLLRWTPDKFLPAR